MDCLALFMITIFLLALILAIAGFALGQAVMGYVFGFFALAGSAPLLWLVLLPAIEGRWGARGRVAFRRAMVILAALILIVPISYLLIAAVRAVGPDPRLLPVGLFFGAVVGGTALLIWWSRRYLIRSWREVADELGLAFDEKLPLMRGSYRGREVRLQINRALRGVSREGVARWQVWTQLAVELNAPPPVQLAIRRRDLLDRLFGRRNDPASGDEVLDDNLVFKENAGPAGRLLRSRPALVDRLQELLALPLRELKMTSSSLIYTCHNALKGSQRVVAVFDRVVDIAELLEAEVPLQEGQESLTGARWEIWYRDTFDRECPPSVDVRGQGLTRGLMELWARHLFETVRPKGGEGFSHFHLWWEEGPSVRIDGDPRALLRLRRWTFGDKRHSSVGYVEESDLALLEQVARAHARLIRSGQSVEAILQAAAEAKDRQDFVARLARLAA